MADNPIEITLQPDRDAIATWERVAKGVVKPAAFNSALARAINRALAAAKTQAKREIAQRFTVKQKDVADTIKTRSAGSSRLQAELRFKGHGIPAIKFKVKPNTPQPAQRPIVTIQYKKDGGGPAPGKFVATMKSGHMGVFARSQDKFMKKNPLRQAIDELIGPSVVGMLTVNDGDPSQAIQDRADEILSARIDHEMRRLLSK